MRVLTDGGKMAGVLTRALAAGVMAIAPASGTFACGYDSPQSVSRGTLNWVYPESLHVIGAISREIAARRLPLANFDQSGPDLFGRRFGATKTALSRLAEMFRAASPKLSQTSIALVLVEPVLWTRFEPEADGLHARVHVPGAELGDLVLVSGEAVIGEIASGRLMIGEAARLGLIRFYGSDKQKAEFIGTYQLVGTRSPVGASRDRVQSSLSVKPQKTTITYARPPRAADASSTSLPSAFEVQGQPAYGPARR